jgi:hypothetical protein
MSVPGSEKSSRVASRQHRNHRKRGLPRKTRVAPKNGGFLKAMASAMTPKRHKRIASPSTHEEVGRRTSFRAAESRATLSDSISSEAETIQIPKRRSPLCDPSVDELKTTTQPALSDSLISSENQSKSGRLRNRESQLGKSLAEEEAAKGTRKLSSKSGSRGRSKQKRETNVFGEHNRSGVFGSRMSSKDDSDRSGAHSSISSNRNVFTKLNTKLPSNKSGAQREDPFARYEKPTVHNETSEIGSQAQNLRTSSSRPIHSKSVSPGSLRSSSQRAYDQHSSSSKQHKPAETTSHPSNPGSNTRKHSWGESDLLGKSGFERPGIFASAPNFDDHMDALHDRASSGIPDAANAFCS